MAHLEAARMVAHHGGLYHTNAEVKLQGKRWGRQSPFPSAAFPARGSSPAPDGASRGHRVPVPSRGTESPSLQVSRAERSCWRSSAPSSSCGCSGAAAGPRAARPSATRSSTRSSPRCPTSWSRRCASASCNPPQGGHGRPPPSSQPAPPAAVGQRMGQVPSTRRRRDGPERRRGTDQRLKQRGGKAAPSHPPSTSSGHGRPGGPHRCPRDRDGIWAGQRCHPPSMTMRCPSPRPSVSFLSHLRLAHSHWGPACKYVFTTTARCTDL